MTDNASRKRRADGYEPGFDLDLEYGQQAELFVADIAEAIKNGMVEVKRDARWHQTGNLYVEYECKRAGEFRASGIKTSDADLWAFVLGDTDAVLFLTRGTLRELCLELYKQDSFYRVETTRGSHPTKGVKVPLGHLIDWLRRRQKELERGKS